MANKVSRRQFLHTASIGALGAAMAGALVGCSGSSGSSSTASASGTYTPGSYSATSKGISSDVTVTMTFDAESITDVTIDVSGETEGFGKDIGDELKEQILKAQSAEIDGHSGATITSDAVKDAVANCVAQAKGEPVVSTTPGQSTAEGESWRTAPDVITEFAKEYTADVVIVGGGQAGTPAARAAIEAGASVIVIESQTEDAMSFRGGGQIGHLNSEFLASKGIPQIDIQEFVTDWQLRTNNRSRCGLIMAYAKNSGKCFDWMTDSFTAEEKDSWSVRQWPLSSNYTQKKSGISTWVGTPTLNGDASPVKRCMEIAREKGADYHFGTKACQLIKDGDAVVGVVGKEADGSYIKFTAKKGVILCGGGFGGNAEMCRDLLIEISDYCSDDTAIGGMDDDGSGIQLGYWGLAAVWRAVRCPAWAVTTSTPATAPEILLAPPLHCGSTATVSATAMRALAISCLQQWPVQRNRRVRSLRYSTIPSAPILPIRHPATWLLIMPTARTRSWMISCRVLLTAAMPATR